MSNSRFLMRVVAREVRTLYTVSEMLECGHRYESLALLSDPLTAKHRICAKCAQALAIPPKKPSTSVLPQGYSQGLRKVSGG
jgi:hypothetical protein